MTMTAEPDNGAEHLAPVTANADEQLGQRLKAAREARQLSQQAVATRSKWADPEGKGVSRTALIGYEAGTSRPGARELRILCQTLAVSPNMLLFGVETPSSTAHPALETLAGGGDERSLRQAVELAFVLASLKGHERDALASLALSVAGRQLGDLRLGFLRTLASMAAPEVRRQLTKLAPKHVDPETMSLEALVDAITEGSGANFGNNLRLDGDEVVGGEWLYRDPKNPPHVENNDK